MLGLFLRRGGYESRLLKIFIREVFLYYFFKGNLLFNYKGNIIIIRKICKRVKRKLIVYYFSIKLLLLLLG